MTDTTSLVPKYTFPGTLDEQEAALAANPLLRRLNEARRAYEGDRHRPLYHYVNPEAMLNDPNGLCRWQGRWHLFYQAYPPEDTRQHWGHAVSDDWSAGATCPTASTPARRTSASPAPPSSRRTGSSPCTTAPRRATWSPCRAIRCC